LVGIGALVCILAIGLDRSAVLSSTVVDFLLELMLSLAFWRSGSTEVRYCHRLLACILAIGLDRSAVLASTFGLHSGDRARQYWHRLLVAIDALVCILAIGLDRSAVLWLSGGGGGGSVVVVVVVAQGWWLSGGGGSPCEEL
jgi:hypothetical protein